MIRFLTFLLNKPYESCKSCETLKQQLDYERSNNKQLQDTLIQILRPTIQEAVPTEVPNIAATSVLFSRRRAAMEEKARHEAAVSKTSKVLAKPDIPNPEIEKLEEELGLKEG